MIAVHSLVLRGACDDSKMQQWGGRCGLPVQSLLAPHVRVQSVQVAIVIPSLTSALLAAPNLHHLRTPSPDSNTNTTSHTARARIP